jgi:hypothetical protein
MISRKTKVASAMMLVLIFCFTSQSNADEEQKQYDFFIGDWACTWFSFEGDVVKNQYPCDWKAYYTFNGSMVQDDFQMFNSGDLIFAGTTLRTYVATKNRWDLAFLSAKGGHYPNFYGNWADGNMHVFNTGEDSHGKFIGKILFTNIKDDSFDWEMRKSYDGGQSWQLSYRIEALRKPL